MASGGDSYPKLDKCVKKRINNLTIKDHKCFNIIQTKDLLLWLKSVLPDTRREEIERKYDREGNISALYALLDTMVKHGNYAVKFLEFLVNNNQKALAELVMKDVEISEIDHNVPNFIWQLVICDDFSSLPPSYDQIDYDQAEAYRKYREGLSDQISANTTIHNDVDTCLSLSHPSNVTLLDQNIPTNGSATLSAPPPLNNPELNQNDLFTTRSSSVNPSYALSTPISNDPTSISINSQQNHPLHVVVPSNNLEAKALYPAVDAPPNPNSTLLSKPNLSTIVEGSGHYTGPEQQKIEIPHNRSPLEVDRHMKESHTEGQVDREVTIPKALYSEIPVDKANDRGKFEGNGEKTKIGSREDRSGHYQATSYSFETTIIPNKEYQATPQQHATQNWTDERKCQNSGITRSEVCISSFNASERDQFAARVDLRKIEESNRNKTMEDDKNDDSVEKCEEGMLEEHGEHIENKEISPTILKESSMKSKENEKEIRSEKNQVHVQETMELVNNVEPIVPGDKILVQMENHPGQLKNIEQVDPGIDVVQNGYSTRVDTGDNKLKKDIAKEKSDSTNVEVLLSQGSNTDENGKSLQTQEKIRIDTDKGENVELPHQILNENSTLHLNVAVGLLAVGTMAASWVFR